MHSCKFSSKKVWRVSPSRSFTYLHSLYEKYRKIKKLGIHVSHKHLSSSHAVHLTMFISYCTICLDQHHIQPSQPTTMHDGHPFQTPTPSTASGKFFKQLLAVCKRAQLILWLKWGLHHATCMRIHFICPHLSWIILTHPKEKENYQAE